MRAEQLISGKPTDGELVAFFDGAVPGWAIASDERVPLLPLAQGILDRLLADTHSGRTTFDLVNLPAGDGKSTIVLQVAARVARLGAWAVHWLREGAGELSPEHTSELLAPSAPTLLVLDDAHDQVDTLVAILRDTRKSATGSLHVLAAARDADWKGGGSEAPWRMYCDGIDGFMEHRRRDLDQGAAESVVAAWAHLGDVGLGALSRVEPGQRAAALLAQVRGGEGRSLFGGILAARFDADALGDHLRELRHRLRGRDPTLARAFAAIALVDVLEVDGLDLRLLAHVLGVDEPTALRRIDDLGREGAPLSGTSARARGLRTRDASIAQAVSRQLVDEATPLDERFEQLLPQIVQGAVILSREAADLGRHVSLASIAPHVHRRLDGLVDPAIAARTAAEAARLAFETHPRVATATGFLLALMRRADTAQRAGDRDDAAMTLEHASGWAESTRQRFAQISDAAAHVRGFYEAWGQIERRAGNAQRGAWLTLCALSDQVPDIAGGQSPFARRDLGFALLHLLELLREGQRDHVLAAALQPFAVLEPLLRELVGHAPAGSGSVERSDLPDADAASELLRRAAELVAAARPAWFGADLQLSFQGFRREFQTRVLSRTGPILRHRPASGESSDLWLAFNEYCDAARIEPYDIQQKAFEAIFEHKSVVLATPTGSGKSLVALAAHFACFWRGHRGLDANVPGHLRRSVYTAPTKALVNEKFFNLCSAFGSRNVGLMTGDATVNPEAPVICCTAEILESMALRLGAKTPFGWVVMDEFHYYSDPERGSAWLVPLLEMTEARFLLMSATLNDHDIEAVRDDLQRRTGGAAEVVSSKVRPVPLQFEYCADALLMETIEDVRGRALTPVYIVSFRRQDAAELAGKLKKPLDDAGKQRRGLIEHELVTQRLDTPFGRKLRDLLPHGVAVHHGGMLPKYRRLVERLATQGLVNIISGTDTLGVGVNMPIRAVIFSQLYKSIGRASRRLTAGEFRQVAGRAGRKGHDDVGHVLVMAPEHEVRNTRQKRKTETSGKKFHAESPPLGFKGWNGESVNRLRDEPVERLVTRFKVTGPLVLQILHRSGDGRVALGRLIDSVGGRTAPHHEAATEILAAFHDAGIAVRLDEPGEDGGAYDLRGASDLAASFDRPLLPFVRYALEQLQTEAPDYDLQVLTVAESVLDDPDEILNAQRRKARDARRKELWAPGQSIQEADAMKEELDAITHPRPMAEELEIWFRAWTARNPHIADHEPSPKSVARDLVERGISFIDFVREHDLQNHEHTLYHHLADVQKILARALPPAMRNPSVERLIEDLAALVDQVDASVAEEWARFELEPTPGAPSAPSAPAPELAQRGLRLDGLLRRMVRTLAFEWVRALARRDYAAIAEGTFSVETARGQFEPYWTQHEEVLLTPDARGPDLFEFDADTGRVRQWILDPQDERQWVIEGEMDMDASREQGAAIVRVVRIRNQSDMLSSAP